MNAYEQYGKLIIQREILEGKILEVKRRIAEEMNKLPVKEGKEKEKKIGTETMGDSNPERPSHPGKSNS